MAFLAGDPLPAASLNRMGCTLRRAAAQTLNDATLTTVSWDTQDVDTHNLWSSGTTITIPETGLWAITATVTFAAATGGRSFIDIVPSSGFTQGLRFSPGDTSEQEVAATAVTLLSAANTVTVKAYRDAAAGTTMTARITCYRVVGGA